LYEYTVSGRSAPIKKEMPMLIKSAILCLALNIYFESRGEHIQGQYAVAHVTLNRVKQNKSDICTEVFKKGQFSWTRYKFKIPDNKDESWILAQKVAHQALLSKDNTFGATYFHSESCRSTSIFKKKLVTKSIGKHIFYAER
jgi:spore germination cell wall hydrolase CwlJ-like protein